MGDVEISKQNKEFTPDDLIEGEKMGKKERKEEKKNKKEEKKKKISRKKKNEERKIC